MENAAAYDELSKPQYKTGCELIDKLNIPRGAEVLDMGCGTGHVSKYIADMVGPDGQVVAVDPDKERIKFARGQYKDVSQLQFHVGNSVTGFPHDSEPYYDFHVSTNAFHWLSKEEKQLYVQKAYQCLKPGGKVGIWCLETIPSIIELSTSIYALSQDGYSTIFQDQGLFSNVQVESRTTPYWFRTFEELRRWLKASTGMEVEEFIKPMCLSNAVFKETGGGVTYKLPRVSIMANKN